MSVSALADPKATAPGWGVENAELDEGGASLRYWRLQFTQIARGPCTGSVQEKVLSSMRLLRVCPASSVAVSSEPLVDANPFQVGLITPAPERIVWNGRGVRGEHLMAKEGAEGSNWALPGGCEVLIARLDRRRLEALTAAFRGGEDPPPGRVGQLHRVPSGLLDELRSQLGMLVRGDLTERAGLLEQVERDVHQQVALALAAPREPIPPSPEARRRVLRRAEEYMRAHAQDRISLADVCMASECSERTLRYVFQERYGVSPMVLLKRLRLQGLRRDLRKAAPGSTTVLDLALGWGFWHLGHLGRDYKLLFGETPAATLARTPGRGSAAPTLARRL